jgi:ribosomal protein S18 acetylase RimI-like enzyme
MSVSQPTTAIHIRPADSGDAAGIAMTFLESAEHHARLDPERYRVPSIETVVKRYREAAPPNATEPHVTLVAERHDEIVGFVEARCERSPDPMYREMLFCHVAELAVSRRHRSRGVGAMLLRAAEDWGRRHGATCAVLEYHTANIRAGAFYRQKMGYAIAAITAIKSL